MKFVRQDWKALALLGVLAMFAGPASADSKVLISMSSGVNQVPTIVAVDQGFFKDAGVDVDLKPVGRGAIAIEALAGGSVQFAEAAHTTFFSAVNKGLPLVAVGIAARGYYGKLIASNDNGDLKTLSDFKGKRIGIQVGTGMHMVVQMLLKKEGLTEDDFTITNIRVTDMPAAMATGGAFDAVIGWEPGMQRIVQSGNGVEVITARDFEEMAGITYPFPLSTTRAYLEANPEVVQKVLDGYARADKFITDNPEKAVDIYAKYLNSTGGGLDRETAKYMMFDTDRFGGVAFTERDMQDLEATRQFLLDTRDMQDLPPVEDMIVATYAEKAEEAVQ